VVPTGTGTGSLEAYPPALLSRLLNQLSELRRLPIFSAQLQLKQRDVLQFIKAMRNDQEVGNPADPVRSIKSKEVLLVRRLLIIHEDSLQNRRIMPTRTRSFIIIIQTTDR
jgi:hypothetical protein